MRPVRDDAISQRCEHYCVGRLPQPCGVCAACTGDEGLCMCGECAAFERAYPARDSRGNIFARNAWHVYGLQPETPAPGDFPTGIGFTVRLPDDCCRWHGRASGEGDYGYELRDNVLGEWRRALEGDPHAEWLRSYVHLAPCESPIDEPEISEAYGFGSAFAACRAAGWLREALRRMPSIGYWPRGLSVLSRGTWGGA